MGAFIYDRSEPIEIEDRTLAHLQVVIIDKLRRDEHFSLVLRDDRIAVTFWLGPRTPLQFIYHGNRQPAINHEWIELLAGEAGVTGMLTLLPEPVAGRERERERELARSHAAQAIGHDSGRSTARRPESAPIS